MIFYKRNGKMILALVGRSVSRRDANFIKLNIPARGEAGLAADSDSEGRVGRRSGRKTALGFSDREVESTNNLSQLSATVDKLESAAYPAGMRTYKN